jgi:hypothetical protein
MRLKLVALAFSILVPPLAVAQSASLPNSVVLYINVVDKGTGKPSSGLRPEDIRLRIGGTVVPVISVEKDGSSRRLAIVLDSSGSMELGKPKWSVASSLAAAIAATAPSSAELSFVAFGSKELKVLRSGNDHREIVEQITALRDQAPSQKGLQRTSLWDSLARVVDQPLPLQRGDSIFVITDGGDNVSHIDATKVEKRLSMLGIRVFGFALDSGEPKTEEEHEGPQNLRELTGGTGGDCFTLQGDASLGPNSPANFSMSQQDRQSIQNLIFNFLTDAVQPYRVELDSATTTKPGKLKIDILENGVERKDVVVLAPARILPSN